MNQILDGDCAEAIAEIFSEVIVAPDFSAEALAILQKKKNLRLLKILKSPLEAGAFDIAERRRGFIFVATARFESGDGAQI